MTSKTRSFRRLSGGRTNTKNTLRGGRNSRRMSGGSKTRRVSGGRKTRRVSGGRKTRRISGGRKPRRVSGGRKSSGNNVVDLRAGNRKKVKVRPVSELGDNIVYDLDGAPMPVGGVFHAQIILQVCGQQKEKATKPCRANGNCTTIDNPSKSVFVMLEAVANSLFRLTPCVDPQKGDPNKKTGFLVLHADFHGGQMAGTTKGHPIDAKNWKISPSRSSFKRMLDRVARDWEKNKYGWHPTKNNCQDFVWYVVRQLTQAGEGGKHQKSLSDVYEHALQQKACQIVRQGRAWAWAHDKASSVMSAMSRGKNALFGMMAPNTIKGAMQASGSTYLYDRKKLKLPKYGKVTHMWVKWNVAAPISAAATDPSLVTSNGYDRALFLTNLRLAQSQKRPIRRYSEEHTAWLTQHK
ncbi:hypothetical protein OAM67_01335 [bacterium]|nr:hypothetical protein [bacterium]